MKVKELIEILSKYDGNAEIVVRDWEYTEYSDHWKIADAYETNDGTIKITPLSEDRLESPDSKQQTEEAKQKREAFLKSYHDPSKHLPARPSDRGNQ